MRRLHGVWFPAPTAFVLDRAAISARCPRNDPRSLLVLDGVYRRHVAQGRLRFMPVPAPSTEELEGVRRIAGPIGRSLERSGLITRDIENAYLAFDPTEEPPDARTTRDGPGFDKEIPGSSDVRNRQHDVVRAAGQRAAFRLFHRGFLLRPADDRSK